MEPFVVKHYSADERPTLKGNGFDGLEIGETREEAEEFVDQINRLIAQREELLVALTEERRIRVLGQSPECGQTHWESMRDLRRSAYAATDAAIARCTTQPADGAAAER